MFLKKLPIFVINALFITFLFSACANDAPTENNATNTATPVEYGINIFQKNCISCHGAEGNMGFNGAADLSKSTISIAEKISIITNGRKTMTPFNLVLSAEDIKKVAEYTETLKK
jgi:cytochrome c6